MGQKNKKHLLITSSLLAPLAIASFISVPSQSVHAQELDDSIDAELEADLEAEIEPAESASSSSSAASSSPSSSGASASSSPSGSDPLRVQASEAEELEDIEDLELDLGDEEEPKTAAAPVESQQVITPEVQPEIQAETQEPTPQSEQSVESSVAEPAPEPEAPAEASEGEAAVEVAVEATDETSVSEPFSDEPNFAFEKRIHEIFQRTTPLSDTQWQEMIAARRAETYNIQAGDTLWDMSKVFFGDGFYWSKLWAQNKTIENPHQIVPGNGIRFIAGDEASEPIINVAKAEINVSSDAFTGVAPTYKEDANDLLVPEDIESGLIETDELLAKPPIPPQKPVAPVLQQLPEAFKSKAELAPPEYDSTGLSIEPREIDLRLPDIVPNSYLADKKPTEVGTIEEVEVGDRVASLGQNVIIKLDRPAQAGDLFTVVLAKGNVSRSAIWSVGPVVEVSGRVEVLDVVNSNKNVYRARVVFALSPVSQGSALITDPLPRTNFSKEGRKSQVSVKILGGEYDESRRILGESAVIYLDGGAKAGLSVNDILTVQARRGAVRESTKYPDLLRPIALIKVFKVEDSVASAIVLESLEEVKPGDLTGGEYPSAFSGLNERSVQEVSPVSQSPREAEVDASFNEEDEVLDLELE